MPNLAFLPNLTFLSVGRQRALVVFAVCVMAVAAVWALKASRGGHDASPGARDVPRPNIVFLLLDTVRADHMSCYGYARETTPHIDALARRGVLFRNAQSNAPWTIPSIASLWTGMQPTIHGAGIPKPIKEFKEDAFRGFNHDVLETLPQKLRGVGYSSFAHIANPLLDMGCYTDGFDECEVRPAPADRVVDNALGHLASLKGSQPFFLYLHFMDAHQPINPPPRFRDQFVTDGKDRSTAAFAQWGSYFKAQHVTAPGFPAFRDSKIAVYDGSIRFMDEEVGRLLEGMRAEGMLGNTIVVVSADHGEELWDHTQAQAELYDMRLRRTAGVGHGHTQFQELLHVPLVISAPSWPAMVIDERVSLLDLPATLLELASGGSDASIGQSLSLTPVVRRESATNRITVAEETHTGYELKAIIDGNGHKLIRATHDGDRDAVYDLVKDPGEQHDLAEQQPALATALRVLLRDNIERALKLRVRPGQVSKIPIDELKKLGYGK